MDKAVRQPVPEAAAELPKPGQVTFGKTVPDFGIPGRAFSEADSRGYIGIIWDYGKN